MQLPVFVALSSCLLALIPIAVIWGVGTPYAPKCKVRGRLGRLLEF